MALQSQTHANLQSCYYIRGADPIVPGDQAIIGPVEILPSDTSSLPAYYNRFNQTNATGLSISEFKTLNNEPLSEIVLNINNSILLTSQRPGEEAVLEVGVNQAGDAGRVTINANDVLVIKNLAGAGKGLQIYHDGPTNQNRIETADITPAGARMNFNVNTSDITFTNDVTADFMKISPQTNIFQVETPGAGLTAVTPGGVGFIGVGTNGRVGPFGGASVTLDSSQGVTIRTSAGVAPLPNYNTMTANANGTVNFLSTITAPTGNLNTGNISTINSSTMTVTGNARIASVAVTNDNTASSVPYSTYYGNYQGNLRYNTIRDTAGAPATAIESLEIVNVAGGPQTGGIQFYTANNGTPNLVKWMGGFLQNNVGAGQSEFRLASTVTASMPQLLNVSTINNTSITNFGVPVGTILSWAGFNINAIPTGFLLCDGATRLRADYPALYAVIGDWGNASPDSFTLPDSRGKTLTGSITVPSNQGVNGPYRVNSTYRGLTTISLPPTFGGGSRVGIAVDGLDGQLFAGMFVDNVNFSSTPKIIGFINSDGFQGQTLLPLAPTSRVIILFDISMPTPTGSPGFIRFSMPDENRENAPYIRQFRQDFLTTPQPGLGTYGLVQKTYEVGTHQHSGTPDTATITVAGGGGPLANRGGNTNNNVDIFTYTDPVNSISYNAPSAMITIPYNIATWQIIKF